MENKMNARVERMKFSYVANFTVHGLSRIFLGHTVERIFWFVCLTAALCVTGHMFNIYYTNYSKNDIRTEVRIIEKDLIPFPSVTICMPLYPRYACYKGKSLLGNGSCPPDSASKLDIQCSPHHPCKVTRDIPDCLTINADGAMKSRYTHLPIVVTTKPKQNDTYIHIYVNTPEHHRSSSDVSMFAPYNVVSQGVYDVLLEQKETSRLPAPYPSNCTATEGNGNMFSKRYSRSSCFESCFLRNMLAKCGGILDRWAPLLPQRVPQNLPQSDPNTCLMNMLDSKLLPDTCPCPLPCHEMDFGATVSRVSEFKDGWLLYLMYKSHKVTSITEKPDYPFEQFLSEVGGLVGLLVGMSVLSVIEIVVYCVVSLLQKCYTGW